MREIKFRAWFGDKMLSDLDFVVYAGGAKENSYGDMIDLKDSILMQYTSLKDKNGVEIYEGDIVAESGGINRNVVIWDDYQWNIKEFYAPSYDYPSCAFSEKMIFEVIGNIHQNPDLIK